MMERSEKIKYVNMIIVLCFIFGFQFIPPVGPLTPTGMHVLGIFIGVVYGWSTIDLIWPSLFAILSMSYVDGYTFTSVVAAGLGSTTFWIIFFMVLYVLVFERAGGTVFLATWFITRKITRGRPLALNFMILLAAFIIGKLNGIASCLLFYNILYGICAQVGYKPHDKYPTLMILGITFAAMFGAISLSISGAPLILANSFQAASGIALTIVDFFKVGFLFGIFLMFVFTLSLKYVFRCDFGPLMSVNVEELVDMNALKVTPKLKIMLVLTVIMIIWIAGGPILPKEWLITQLMNTLGLQGIAMILLGLLMYTKVDGKYMFKIRDYSAQIQWDVLFVAATIMPMSSMLTMKGTGIDEFITNILGGFLTSLPTVVFVAGALLLSTILTNFGNNVSICILLMPVILNVCASSGIDPVPVFMCLIFSAHLAMLTPGACPYAALVWGSTEWITPKEIYKYASIIMVIFYICIIVLGYNWAMFIL